MLNLASFNKWRCVKADAKFAFLQTQSQTKRDIFAVPVGELSGTLQIARGQAVCLLKAAYGLASAPREWFLDVAAAVVEQDCHMGTLHWVLQVGGVTARAVGSPPYDGQHHDSQ